MKIFYYFIINIVSFILLFINFFLLYIDRYFGEISFQQLIFHLNFSNNLLINTDEYIIKKFFQICIYQPILIILIINLVYFMSKIFRLYFFSKYVIIFFFILSLIAVFNVKNSIKFGDINVDNNIDIIKDLYVNPKDINFNFENNKNLILIYMESFENIFKNEDLFEENLIEKISNYNKNSQEFKNFNQTTLTNWTIASIVATHCALPLKNYGVFTFGERKGKHLRTLFGMDNFIPKAICLGDLLKSNGYKNIFVGSHNTNFSGTGKFFKSHGYNEVYGKEIYEKKNIKFHPGSWAEGPHDSFLFEFSKNKVEELTNLNQKFNITILTSDTHEPNGFHDPICNHNDKIINSALKCSSENLLKFIKFVKNKYNNEIRIVVLGDHLYRFGNDITFDLPKNRSIFNKFFSNTPKKIMREDINHYDFFPTIIDFIDVKYEENKLGMGYSGFKEVNEKIYLNSLKKIRKHILNRSKFYESFWN